MKRIWPWLAPAVCGVVLQTTCQRTEREQDAKETEEFGQRQNEQLSDTPADRAAFEARIKKDVAEVDAGIAELRTGSKTATEEDKKRLDAELAEIDQNRNELGGEIAKIEKSDAPGWPPLKKRIESSLSDLRRQVQSARDRWKPAGKT